MSKANFTIHNGDDDFIAIWLSTWIGTALARQSGLIALTLPGGSTPFPILARLVRSTFDWGRITVWPGDDRIVPEDHLASNVGRIRALLEPLGATIVPLVEGAKPPHFTLAWLGMGNDGHIASLFPNTDPQINADSTVIRLTPDPLPPEAPFNRLSLTIPALLNSDAILFVARGAEKHALLEAAARGENDLPIARLLAAATQPVTCFT